MANDDEMFDAYVREHGLPKSNGGDRQIRLSEYTPILSALSDLHEMMQSNIHGVFKKKGKPKIQRQARPVTSMGRYKKRRRQRNISHLESMIVRSTKQYEELPDDTGYEVRYKSAEEAKQESGNGKPGRMRKPS